MERWRLVAKSLFIQQCYNRVQLKLCNPKGNPMSPDRFKHLASFIQTAKSGSFTAADVLNLTPAAVSKNVATLEQ